jgi:hypothetical protein
MTFFEALAQQRWDDHRFYHHSVINQSLHLFSALSFLCAYALLWTHPAVAVFIAWILAMPSRQIGHFFFEPRGYDAANDVTHDHKEAIKVGYNLRRKVVLMSAWACAPLILLTDATLFGVLDRPLDWVGFADNLARIWLCIGVVALIGRTIQLCFIRDVQTGFVWCTKILTDPFHDVMLYRNAPLLLLRGERFDPIVTEEIA